MTIKERMVSQRMNETMHNREKRCKQTSITVQKKETNLLVRSFNIAENNFVYWQHMSRKLQFTGALF